MYRVCFSNTSRRLIGSLRPLPCRFGRGFAALVHATPDSAVELDECAEKLHKASLDEDTCNKEVYKEWASDYDDYVGSLKYNGPSIVASRALSHFAGQKNLKRPMKLLDAACGTGLVGKEILGASSTEVSLHGCDYSEDMLVIAKPYYETVRVVDMNQGLPEYKDNEFDVVTCVGAFIEGHVFINPALRECVRVTAHGGVVLATVRTSFFESHFIQALLEFHQIVDIHVECIEYLDGVAAKLVTLRKK